MVNLSDESAADDAAVYRIMRCAGERDVLPLVHAENGTLIRELVKRALSEGRTAAKYHALTRPPLTEADAVSRAISIAELSGTPVCFTRLSCDAALAPLRAARERGLPVFGMTCPHYLFLSYSNYLDPDGRGMQCLTAPPLREAWNQEMLWRALRLGQLQGIASDHRECDPPGETLTDASFDQHPHGLAGVGVRLALAYHGTSSRAGISVTRLVELVSTGPAKLMGLFPRKGTIAVGSDADIVLYDPSAGHSPGDDTPGYRGLTLGGAVRTVLLRGKVIVEASRYVGSAGDGRFIPRGPGGRQ